MKLKTMDIQKFLLTGWYPKMAYNVKRLGFRRAKKAETEYKYKTKLNNK